MGQLNLIVSTQTSVKVSGRMAASLLWLMRADPLTLLTMVETVLERSQHIIGFSAEAQVGIGEVILLIREIREALVDVTVENRVTQSYLRLLHSLLANLGEGIAAVGEFGSQTVPQTRRVADFGNALVWGARAVEYWLVDDRGPAHLGSLEVPVNKQQG